MVARPADAEKALRTARQALDEDDTAVLRQALDEQEHTIVGYLALDGIEGKVVDENGQVLGDLLPGDSFITD